MFENDKTPTMQLKGLTSALLVVLVFLFNSIASYAEDIPSERVTVFHGIPGEADDDTRQIWGNSLLELVLSKTVAEFGPFRLETPPKMAFNRAMKSLRENRFDNFVYSAVYRRANSYDGVEIIYFPINLGLLGYRVCFYPTGGEKAIQRLLAGDKDSVIIGQGREWSDVKVLRHNGYTVLEGDSYHGLFEMTAAGRFDLFCRGINEVFDEYKRYKDIQGLAFDRSFAFHYKLPVFFILNKGNAKAIERIYKGLQKAYEDGSLLDLFHEYYGERLAFSDIASRTVIELDSPIVGSLDKAYLRYNYMFTKAAPGSADKKAGK